MSLKTAAKLYLWIGIIGVVLVIADVTLIALDPSKPGPYFTTFAGLCLVFVGFIAVRSIKRAAQHESEDS